MVNLTLKHKEFEKAQAERRRGLLEEVDARQVWPLVQNRHVLESVWGVSAGFFWTFRKKLKAKKTQAEKKLKQIFEKLKQIIQKLNNLPTKY